MIQLLMLFMKIKQQITHRFHDHGELGISTSIEGQRHLRIPRKVFRVLRMSLAESAKRLVHQKWKKMNHIQVGICQIFSQFSQISSILLR